ncbi:protein trichome birefringence-like 12 isoform X5 [Hevea brasiliensis]|uniref:protein trichome birefringence-like 12 isoform X5 n=1 Tax=Hevea brasiliensis TaxID=3981 RepID=UPI0025E020DB|nr:protein trichome birefringence-like 12 isoform X5 [Hevea brasiliensis]
MVDLQCLQSFLLQSLASSSSPFLYLYSTSLLPCSSTSITTPSPSSTCNLFEGHWVLDPEAPKPFYDESCPFHRNAWNCLRNNRDNMGLINSWKWVPQKCNLPRIDPQRFLGIMRNRNIGFVRDSLNENFLVSFLCILRVADADARRWKKKGAWRGAYFPKFNVTVAYHRPALLAKYQYFLPLVCLMDLKLFLRIWSHIYKRKFLARHSSFGVCNHSGIFMAVSGTKMEVACSVRPSTKMSLICGLIPAKKELIKKQDKLIMQLN